ncbi:hypothetical protein JL722_5589 [Aureococcus anophagefferens]|nr:hypothetical protein JL722_5589 [Aureococcus anophagefferens]
MPSLPRSLYRLELASTGDGWDGATYAVEPLDNEWADAVGGTLERGTRDTRFLCLADGCFRVELAGATDAASFTFADEDAHRFSCGGVGCVEHFCVADGDMYDMPTNAPTLPPTTARPTTSEPSRGPTSSPPTAPPTTGAPSRAPSPAATSRPTYAPSRTRPPKLVTVAVVLRGLPSTDDWPYADCASNRSSADYYNAAREWRLFGELVFDSVIASPADATLGALAYVQCDGGAPLGNATRLVYSFESGAWSDDAATALKDRYRDGSARDAIVAVVCEELGGVNVSCADGRRLAEGVPTLDGLARSEISSWLDAGDSEAEVDEAVVVAATAAPSLGAPSSRRKSSSSTDVYQAAATSPFMLLAAAVLLLGAVLLVVVNKFRYRGKVEAGKPAVELTSKSPRNVEFDDVFGGAASKKKKQKEKRPSLWTLRPPSLAPVEPRDAAKTKTNPMAARKSTAGRLESPAAGKSPAPTVERVFRNSVAGTSIGNFANPMAAKAARASAPAPKSPAPTVEAVFQADSPRVAGANPMRRPTYESKTRIRDAWEELEDPATGRAYWHNPSTGATSWTNPNAETIPSAEVLSAWEVRHDPEHDHPYYYNATTGESRWTPPDPLTEARGRVSFMCVCLNTAFVGRL